MSTELADIRAAIKTRINANFSSIPVAEPGVDVKVDGSSYFMQWDVDYQGAVRAALGSTAGNRINGSLRMAVGARKDATAQPGTATLEAHLDALKDLFPAGLSIAAGSKTANFRVPSPGPTLNDEGWVLRSVTCPFYLFTA